MVLGFWRYSTTAQASSDFTDPEHPSARPWYLDHGCGGIDARDVNLCMTARVSYAFAIISMSVPLTYTNIPPLCATWLDWHLLWNRGFYLCRVLCLAFALVYWCGYYRVLDRQSDNRWCRWLIASTVFSGDRLLFTDSICDKLEGPVRKLDIRTSASDADVWFNVTNRKNTWNINGTSQGCMWLLLRGFAASMWM